MAGDGRIPERVLSWWPHTLCNIVSIWPWGTAISHHSALAYAGQKVASPLPCQMGTGRLRQRYPALSRHVSRACVGFRAEETMWFLEWGLEEILGRSLVCEVSEIARGKSKEKKSLKVGPRELHRSTTECAETGPGGCGHNRTRCSPCSAHTLSLLFQPPLRSYVSKYARIGVSGGSVS